SDHLESAAPAQIARRHSGEPDDEDFTGPDQRRGQEETSPRDPGKTGVVFPRPQARGRDVYRIRNSTMNDKSDSLAVRTDAMLRELGQVQDIPLQIAIEVGRLRLRVRDLMRLAPNSVIELKKLAGEPFDICINGMPVARGEVIVVEQSSGVRIIEVQK